MGAFGLPWMVVLGVMLFLVVLAVLWFLMPFAVFGTKDKLNTLIIETQNVNKALREIVAELATLNRGLHRDQPEQPRRILGP